MKQMEGKDMMPQIIARSGHNVIEFDGNTVLCRVCGDRASGFHYGVHACEGCKGFFRRSIQQKIQYRPCVKNQHCLITRVNRNRCQYCRLKKCIAIGMSRDAVRFGRVPKREKAKILEQMQKVNLQCKDAGSVDVGDETEFMRRIIEAYEHTCQFTSRKAAIFKDEARRKGSYVSCPSKMACPLNPSPEAEHSSVDRWTLYSNGFMPAIHNIVTFAKLIPGFTSLNQDDQIMLLKSGTFEILLLQLSCLFDSRANMMFFTNENIFMRKPHSPTTGAGYLLGSVFDFSERMTNLNLTDSEMALFSAFILFSPDRPGLESSCLIERLQSIISQLLKTEITSNHPNQTDLFDKLLFKIPEMRLLNTVHSEKLLGLTVPSSLAHSTVSPLYAPLPEDDVDQSCLFWTNQQRGLLLPRPIQYSNPLVIPSDWSRDCQGISSVPIASNGDREKRKRKIEGDSSDRYEVPSSNQFFKYRENRFNKDLSVNCHRVSPYSPPQVVLSTPLGTFHRMPLTSWSSDHHRSPIMVNGTDEAMSSKMNKTEMRSFKDSMSPPLIERGSSSSSSSLNVNHLHHKKKVARVWSGDSGMDDNIREEQKPPTELSDAPSSSKDAGGKHEECDSTDVDNKSTPSYIRRDETVHSAMNLKGKLFSDFNINSRFLSYDSTKPSQSARHAPTERIQSSLPCSPEHSSGWGFPKYAKNLVPFAMSSWSTGSAVSAPLFLPPSFSASDAQFGGFQSPLTLLDHLMRRDDKKHHVILPKHPLASSSGRIARDDSHDPTKSNLHCTSI